MTSLSEVYYGGEQRPDLRRLYLGVGLFLAGVLLCVGGIVAAASDLLLGALTIGQARELGGVLGGVGVPAVMLGVITVLPSNRRTRIAAVVGAAASLVGVGLFVAAYPCQWVGATCGAGLPDRTLSTVAVYFAGTVTTFWCLFVGVATFKTRNDPGGTARLDVTRQGETKVVEIERGGGLGGVGLFGTTPDGEVETQTNRDDGSTAPGSGSFTRSGGSTAPSASAAPSGSPASDGGATTAEIRSPLDDPADSDAEVMRDEAPDVADRYCGNCAHFEYVRTAKGIQPYCGVSEELMDDMTACDEWSSRGR